MKNKNRDTTKTYENLQQEIAERKRAEDRMWLQSQILEIMAEGVNLVRASDSVIVYANPGFEQMFGYEPGELVGIHVSVLNAPAEKNPQEIVAEISKVLNEKGEWRGEIYNVRKDCTKFWCSVNIKAFQHPEHGKVWISVHKDITERKRAEEALKVAIAKAEDEKNKSNAIIDAIGDGVIIQDTDYKILYQNKIQNDLFGNRVGEYCYKTYEGKDSICKDCPIELSFKDGKIHKAERRIPTDNGILYSELTGSSLKDSTGKIIAGIKVVRDITGLRRNEKALQESEKLYRTLFETMVQGVVYQNAEGMIISANLAAEMILGLTFDQVSGRTSMDPRWKAVHEDGSDFPGETHPSMVALRTGREVRDVVMGVFNPLKEEYRWININAVPQFRTGEDKPYQVYTIFDDITERKRTEEELRKGELFLESVFASIQDGIGVIDKDMNILRVNLTAERWYPHAAPLIGRKCYEAYHGRSERCEGCPAWKTLKTGESAYKIVPKHGPGGKEVGWLEIYSFPMIDTATGEMRGAIEYVRDITERKRVEKEKDRLLKAIDSSTDGITIADEKDRFIYVNAAYAKIFGYPQEEFIGETWRKITLPELIVPTERELSRTMHNKDIGTFRGEVPGLRKDGIIIPTEVQGTALRDENGNYQGHICVVRDITERKRAEEAIKKYAEKLEEANRMKELFTDIMHHDLINPLTAASGFIELLKEDEIKSRKRAYLETIERNLVKALELMESATKLSKLESSKSIKLTNMDLEKVINEVTGNMSPLAADAGMEIENKINMSMPVKANKIMEEVFANIISNAVKYASSGKRIVLDCKESEGCWNIRFTDFGEGIEDRDKTVIFDRFHRIEKKGVKGSGLGLAIASKIMELHNGRIWVEDNPEGGAVFVVEIPKHPK